MIFRDLIFEGPWSGPFFFGWKQKHQVSLATPTAFRFYTSPILITNPKDTGSVHDC